MCLFIEYMCMSECRKETTSHILEGNIDCAFVGVKKAVFFFFPPRTVLGSLVYGLWCIKLY